MAEVERALFLAAGQGIRLGHRGREVAKGLLEVGGTTLVERAIGRLSAAGVGEIVIVTGHLREQYDALASRLGRHVRTIFNPDYATHGAARSLAVGLRELEGPLLLLEADVLWESRALAALRAHPSASVLLASGPTRAGDEVWVWASEAGGTHSLTALSKQLSFRPVAPYGELVGLARICQALHTKLCSTIAQFEACDRFVPYETCFAAAASEVPVDVLRIDDLIWGEIDDETMYARVRDLVWPSIQAVERQPHTRNE